MRSWTCFQVKEKQPVEEKLKIKERKRKGKIRAQKTKRDENKNKCQGITLKKKYMAEE